MNQPTLQDIYDKLCSLENTQKIIEEMLITRLYKMDEAIRCIDHKVDILIARSGRGGQQRTVN